MASIGGSSLPHFGPRTGKETELAKTAAPITPQETLLKPRVSRPEQTMAQLTGKFNEAKKLKKMAMRKAKRRRRRRKRKRSNGSNL